MATLEEQLAEFDSLGAQLAEFDALSAPTTGGESPGDIPRVGADGEVSFLENPSANPERELLGNMLDQRFSKQLGALGITGEQVANSAVADYAMGINRALQSHSNGIAQMVSTPEEALAIAKIEEQQRKQFQEFEEGFGAEDIADVIVAAGALVGNRRKGGQAVADAPEKALTLIQWGANSLKGLRTIGGSLGGTSALVGLIEATKGTTTDEDRGANSAIAAATTLGFGLGGKAVSNRFKDSFEGGKVGKALAVFGLGALASRPANRVAQEGIMRSIIRGIGLGRKPADPVLAANIATQRSGTIQQGQTLRKAAGMELDQAKDLARNGVISQERTVQMFRDVVEGPFENGKRNARKGLTGVKARASTRKQGVPDDTANAMRAWVLGVLAKPEIVATPNAARPDLVNINVAALNKRWQDLKTMPAFQKVYGLPSAAAKGEFKAGKNSPAAKMDELIESLMTKQSQTGQVGFMDMARELNQDIVDNTLKGKEAIEALKTVPKGAMSRSSMRLNAAAVALEATATEENYAELKRLMEEGDYMSWFDFFGTTQEKADEYREALREHKGK